MDLFYLGSLRKQLALYLENKLGAPSEQIILIITMASAIPFSFLNYLIHDRAARLLYSLIIGFILHYSIYGIQSLHTIFGTVASYLYVKYFGRKLSPFYLLIASMAHLSLLNIIRMIVDYGGWAIDDISTIYMVIVAKVSSFGFSYADGEKDEKDIRSDHLKHTRIEELPSIFEYVSYIFFYPTIIIGPFIEFKDFINFIDQKDCYAELKDNMGFIMTQGIGKLSISILFIVIFALFGEKYSMGAVGTPEFRKNYPEWWKRFLYLYICGPVGRSKYYIAWALTYSSLIFSGMAFGKTIIKDREFPNVEKGSYGSIIYNEFGEDPKLKMVYWNHSIHIWLKYNIYTRILGSKGRFKNNKIMASFITLIFSAVWHGFYPSYIVFFFIFYIFEQDAEFLRSLGFYDYVKKYPFLMPIAILKTIFFFNIIGSIFYCLLIETTKQIAINFYGLPFNALIGCYIVSLIYMFAFKKKKNKNDKEVKIKDKEIKEKEINKKVE